MFAGVHKKVCLDRINSVADRQSLGECDGIFRVVLIKVTRAVVAIIAEDKGRRFARQWSRGGETIFECGVKNKRLECGSDHPCRLWCAGEGALVVIDTANK